MTYKNIVVAVDTTDEAEDIIKVAREISEEKSSAISAFTVIRPMADFYANLYSTIEDSADSGIQLRAVERATEADSER